jgi:hypothetical protein
LPSSSNASRYNAGLLGAPSFKYFNAAIAVAGKAIEAATDCIGFDTALRAYRHGGNPGAPLRAAGNVIDSSLPLAPENADTISVLTDHLDIEIETYGDAAHAIRGWWFAQMWEPGAGH